MPGQYQRKDHLYLQAKSDGYRSRAAYKLVELDQKYKLLKGSSRILDLGCAPGGWLQIASERADRGALIVGVDLEDVPPVTRGKDLGPSPVFIKGDITQPAIQERIVKELDGRADLILSDMSPHLSGIRFRDVARSAELVETAFLLATRLLDAGGTVVTKAFPGHEIDQLFLSLKSQFDLVQRARLRSTRQSSTELYFVAQGYRPAPV